MNHKLWIDLETYSTVDLRTATPYRYAEDPLFQILMAAWSVDGRTVNVSIGHEQIQEIPGLWDPQVLKVAHNAPFERICLSRLAGLPVGQYLPVQEFHDTQAIAGELGYPQKLEKLAVALGVDPKDPAGTRLINLFCKPNKNGERNLPEDHPLEWLDFVFYCEQDVSTLIQVDEALGGWPTEMEREVYYADQVVNDTGIRIDRKMAQHAVRAGVKATRWQKDEVRELAKVDNPASIPQMMEWVRRERLGMVVPNMQKETVERALTTDLNPTQRRVLELRQELALAAPAKFGAALASVSPDDRLRGSFRFFGAHTGRWTGRGTQLQNLPRAAFGPEGEDLDTLLLMKDLGFPKDEVEEFVTQVTVRMTEDAIGRLLAGEDMSADELKKLVRALFVGPFSVVDYSAIEARVIAWLAGEEWALEAFREGRDIYVETAERMGGLTRSEGKVAVLALGYNGGANSLRAMAGEGTLTNQSDDELRQNFVYPWRNANPRIVRLWKMLDNRFMSGGSVGQHLFIEKHGNDRLLRLPSGRAIAYRDVRRRIVVDPETGRERTVLSFRSAQGNRMSTYGGRLAENATQAVARDIEAEAIVRLVRNGYSVVGHVHDEIVVESEDEPTIKKIMLEPPAWSDGLPIAGEGFVCERYRKG